MITGGESNKGGDRNNPQVPTKCTHTSTPTFSPQIQSECDECTLSGEGLGFKPQILSECDQCTLKCAKCKSPPDLQACVYFVWRAHPCALNPCSLYHEAKRQLLRNPETKMIVTELESVHQKEIPEITIWQIRFVFHASAGGQNPKP